MITPPRQPDAVIAKAMLAAAVDQASQPATAEELVALERLLAHAQHDSGQSRVVADFLLAWWSSGSCGAFDLTSLWSLDTAIVADMTVVFGLIGRVSSLSRQHGLRGGVQSRRARMAPRTRRLTQQSLRRGAAQSSGSRRGVALERDSTADFGGG